MSSKRVLIVDDAKVMRARIKSIAQAAGWEVCGEAADGDEAIDQYHATKPDLVTMDIVMPGKTGIDALRELMQADSKAQVVMVTAVNQREKLNECIRLGAIDFIVKPFESETLSGFFKKY